MPRILAIDYGTKRCGLAVTDPLQIIATGLTTVSTREVIDYLKKYTEKEPVECFVIGEPKKLNGENSDLTRLSGEFARHLAKKFPAIRIERLDERFTSRMAFQTLIDSGLKKKDRQNKALIDEVSAVILLQSYLDKIKP